ncbi:MAG: MFS transporter [Bryobacteraceae bacterium]
MQPHDRERNDGAIPVVTAPAGSDRNPGRLSGTELRTLALASLGSALEFYDFIIFVFFTPVIARLFFPVSLPEWVRQLDTFGIFAAGYIARPIGGVILAHFGDTRGRKRVFTATVLFMAIPTLLIGLLPTYRSIGIGAPLLLLTMRLLQGVAIGGEAPGAWVFVAEHARPSQVGFAVGLLTSGLTFGILLGSLISVAMNATFTPMQIAGGFWRLPFLIGGVLGFIAMLLRRWLSETPVFQEMRRRAAASHKTPLRTILRTYKSAIAVSILSTWMLTAAILVVILMTPALLQSLFRVDPHRALLANFAGAGAQCLAAVAIGASVDRFGIRPVAFPMLLLLLVSTYGLYLGAQRAPGLLVPLYVLAGIGAGAAVLTPLIMVRSFPPAVRFTGVAFSYNVSYAVFGGLTPLLVSALAHWSPLSPAHYVGAVSLLALVTIAGGCNETRS